MAAPSYSGQIPRAGNPWQVLIERDALAAEDCLLVTHAAINNISMVLPPLSLIPHERGLIKLSQLSGGSRDDLENLLQAFLDAAWSRGMRPKGYEGPQETKAITRHLEDMRAVAFGKLGIKSP